MDPEKLKAFLESHEKWLRDEEEGNRADLRRAVLSGADLSGADLSGADLDFGVWPLWCGSVGVKVDNRIALQLMYHACAVDYEDCSEHIKQALEELKSTAERFLEYRDDAPKLKKSK